jgi:hypothetical protein
MMLNTAIVARTRKTPAEARKKVSTGPSTIRWRADRQGVYRVPARDAVRRSLAAPKRRRMGDWAVRTVSTTS